MRFLYPCIQIGEVLLPTFSVALGAGVLFLLLFAVLRGRHCGLNRIDLAGAVLAGVLAGAAGVGCAQWLFHEPLQRHVSSIGVAGGCLAAALGFEAWVVARRLSALRLADCMIPGLGLSLIVLRMGCFLAGCDFGVPTSRAWGVTYNSGLSLAWYGTPLGTALHPVQLYESVLVATSLGLLLLLQRRRPTEGTVCRAFVALYSVGRFFIEFLRGDADRGFWGALSYPQWLCLLGVAWAAFSFAHGLQPAQLESARRAIPAHRWRARGVSRH